MTSFPSYLGRYMKNLALVSPHSETEELRWPGKKRTWAMGISHTMGMTRVPSDLFHRGPQKLLLLKTPMVSTTTIDPYRADHFFCPTDTVCRCYLPESFPALSPSYPARTRICTHLQSVLLCLHECKTVA